MALRKFTRNLGMFLDFFELIIENKKQKVQEKLFWLYGLRWMKKWLSAKCLQKMALKKKLVLKFLRFMFFFYCFDFLVLKKALLPKYKTIFTKQFLLNYFFLFLCPGGSTTNYFVIFKLGSGQQLTILWFLNQGPPNF